MPKVRGRMTAESVTLTAGDCRLALQARWGAITHLSWRGVDILRDGRDARDPTETAMFALVPFANRIAMGRFEFGGRSVRLSPNYRNEPHALHGHGWQSAWRLDQVDAATASLSFLYEGEEWPWPYAAWQRIELSEHGARFELGLCNLSGEPMPASLGFHPYFPARTRSTLTAQVRQMWAIDATTLPTTLERPAIALGQGAAMRMAPFIDNCFTTWDGALEIRRDDVTIDMSADSLFPFLHLYVPNDDYFCAEPVSAMPDALNRSDAKMHVIAPGEELAGAMTLIAR